MRLTLRTLIAYLDQTIGKDDAAALRAKINDAESIRVLIERIKRVVSQPQLMAARSTGKGVRGESELCQRVSRQYAGC